MRAVQPDPPKGAVRWDSTERDQSLRNQFQPHNRRSGELPRRVRAWGRIGQGGRTNHYGRATLRMADYDF